MLTIERVSVDYGGQRVLDSVSAQVDGGQWLSLLGPNGAGKTTLLRAVLGLVEFKGTISITGRTPRTASRREAARLVAYVPQRPVLPPAMTVTDYVLLGRSAHHRTFGAETASDRRVAATVLERLGLGPFAERRLGEVSGGEAQRAVLARALAQQAPVLVLDEPTASLDLGHGQLVLELAQELRREHTLAVVCAMHDLTVAGQYADAMVVLTHGRVAVRGAPRAVLTKENIEAVYGTQVEIFEGRDGVVVAPSRPRLQVHPRR